MIYTLPLLIREDHMEEDLRMLNGLFESLGPGSVGPGARVVIYNQGCLSDLDISSIAARMVTRFSILGDRVNVGIPIARQACFEFIWQHYPDDKYIVEAHVDMQLVPGWDLPLIYYLETTDEPCISPGIITAEGHLHPADRTPRDNPRAEDFRQNRIVEGFVHPVIHKSECLKAIGGYPVKFISGTQGYDDDAILLGYHYLMGTRAKWKPKVNLNSVVYHRGGTQRSTLPNADTEMLKNLKGLVDLYGYAGIKALGDIHDSDLFRAIYERRVGQ